MGNYEKDNNVEQTLDDIKEIVKIEKIHEERTYFDQLADDIEVEVRDILMDQNALKAEMDREDKVSGARVFRLKPGENIVFDFPPPFKKAYKGDISEFSGNIQVKVIAPKKRKMSEKEKERRKLNIMFYKFGRTCALAVLLFALGMIGEQIYGYVSDYEHYEMIKELYGNTIVDVTPDREIPDYPKVTPARISYPEKKTLAELEAFEGVSNDFRFWIYIEGTGIDYYVLQSSDNEFYLRRDIYKGYREGSAGSIFLDYRNNVTRMFSDEKAEKGSHSIVYGHNMKSGMMFGKLKEFQKDDYFFKHQYIYTYSTQGVTVWKIFSAYETTTEDYYIQTYFNSANDYLQFIKNLQKKSDVVTDIVLSPKDDILTLSTCHRYTFEDGRFVVHAVKVGTAPIN